MSNNKYLDSILKVMPAVQAKQIADLLQDLQVSGQVRNASEYEAKLKELSALVNSSVPQPSFNQIRALVWNLCSSDAYNTMTKAAKNDIEAAFLQVDEIGQKLSDHHRLFMSNVLKDLERNIQSQENTIRRLEWLANQNNEFSRVLVNNFSSSSLMKVPISDPEADIFYYDNRTFQNISQTTLPLAVVSERGEKLLLDVANDPVILPVQARLQTDNSSYGTELYVDYDSNLNNIIDGQQGTFWTRTIYVKEQVPRVNTIIEFDLGLAKDVSYIIIEGATPEAFLVLSIQGVSPGGNRVDLISSEITVNGRSRIDFPRTFLRSVMVTFSVQTYSRADYFLTGEEKAIEIFDTENKFNKLLKKDYLAPVIRKAMASENMADLCNVPKYLPKQINYYNYTFALDNVWFGNSIYKDVGIFVSKPLSLKNPGVLGIKVDTNTETGIIRNTIEYEIIKIDRSPKQKITKIPIPYLGQSSVTSERLILTKKETNTIIYDVGMLRFLPYISSTWVYGDDDPVIIYKNGSSTPLASSEWDFAIAESSLATNWTLDWQNGFVNAVDWLDPILGTPKYKLSPPKMWIKIKNPELNAVYTVDYTIRTSDSHPDVDNKIIWLDKDKTVQLNHQGRIRFEQEDPDVTIESDIYLQITLRRNISSQSKSPELYEYAVLAATYS